MDKKEYLEIADSQLSKAEEYIDVDMCDDGLVFHHLQNAVINYLKALASDFNLDVENISSIQELIDEIENRTTVSFPDFIDEIREMDDILISTGCSTSLCFDLDFYGDIYDAVIKLRDFVKNLLED